MQAIQVVLVLVLTSLWGPVVESPYIVSLKQPPLLPAPPPTKKNEGKNTHLKHLVASLKIGKFSNLNFMRND